MNRTEQTNIIRVQSPSHPAESNQKKKGRKASAQNLSSKLNQKEVRKKAKLRHGQQWGERGGRLEYSRPIITEFQKERGDDEWEDGPKNRSYFERGIGFLIN